MDEHDEDDTSPIAPHYGLAFFDRDHIPHSRHGKLWFRIDTIRAIENEAELDRLLRDWVDGNLDLDDKQRANARANLERLWRAIWRDQAITYFTERGVSYDRVLDIFIRANSAGSPLSRDDLLMSVITLRWERFNARDETEGVIQYLNKKLAPKRNVNRKFILRTALFLNDLDFTIQVRNFVPRNIRLLEESWDRIKEILTFSADYLRASGLYGERLGGINVLMLVAYYVHKTNPGQGALQLSDKDRQRIRRWIVMLSFQGLLCLQTNNTFNVYRNTVCRALSRDTGFPWVEIAQAFQNMGRAIDFGDQSLNRWYSTPLDHQPQAELLLSLLYSDDLPNLRRRAVPVVQRYQFAPDELRRAGVEDTRMPVVKEYENKLILGVALDEAEQVNYRALPFEQWAQTLSPEFMTHHCLPTDIGLYRLDRLPDWVIERRNLLTQRLSNPIGD